MALALLALLANGQTIPAARPQTHVTLSTSVATGLACCYEVYTHGPVFPHDPHWHQTRPCTQEQVGRASPKIIKKISEESIESLLV